MNKTTTTKNAKEHEMKKEIEKYNQNCHLPYLKSEVQQKRTKKKDSILNPRSATSV